MKKRKSNRLKGYNYSQIGYYFVTVETKYNICHLGKIINKKMFLSPIGEYAKMCWKNITIHFPHIKVDSFVIMPNHIHGILVIEEPLISKRLVWGNNYCPILTQNNRPILTQNNRPILTKNNRPILTKNKYNTHQR